MLRTLATLKGTPRACVLTEPLWALPNNLYAPYASLFMVAIGLTQIQIGWVSTLFFISQMVFAFVGGAITDKMGRRYATFLFDLVGWSLPCLLWAFSQNFVWFAIAALVNGVYRITQTSWNCLLVEDMPNALLVKVYALINIAGLISGFFSPITIVLLRRLDLISTVRILYGFSFLSMTAKFIILYIYSTETKVGARRMVETQGVSLRKLLGGYGSVVKLMLHNKATLITLFLWLAQSIAQSTYTTFVPILMTERIGVPTESIALIATIKPIITLVCYLTITPRINTNKYKPPLLIGIGSMVAANTILLLIAQGAYMPLIISIAIDAVAITLIYPTQNALQMLNLDVTERARSLSVFQSVILLISAPFGVLAGVMSEASRALPFLLVLVMYIFAGVCALIMPNKSAED